MSRVSSSIEEVPALRHAILGSGAFSGIGEGRRTGVATVPVRVLLLAREAGGSAVARRRFGILAALTTNA
jgi:hypothetical protein